MREELKEHNLCFVVGMPKNGTTSLADWLTSIEDVSVHDVKEPHYFLPECNGHRGIVDYSNYISGFNKNKNNWFDCSTLYCFYDYSIEEISKVEGAKVILIIREPKSFLQSHFAQQYSTLDEIESDVNIAYRRNNSRDNTSCRDHNLIDYSKVIDYGAIIRRITARFNEKNALFIYYEDLIYRQHETLSEIAGFCNLKVDEIAALPKSNVRKNNPSISRYINRIDRNSRLISLFRYLNNKLLKGAFTSNRLELFMTKFGRNKLNVVLDEELINIIDSLIEKDRYVIEKHFGSLPVEWKY
ncbi:sulfotransferase domain-containing protein [Vibrio paucivorans]|uniref:Sulfotransferase domain-containing protein n=1 Tax=Vibrio paucivorans TaxID=2829489 RepID=A0A9X3CD56_9VIBR|nr:sulfotransferase domain-containing protein [Vibrio paucivorans]MCW8333619.1 sulfotransferase domain-containing protein [Vibrio paucivorans]